MKDVISEVTLKNMAFSEKSGLPAEVIIHNVLDDRYAVTIQIGEWKTKILKEDLKRVVG